MGVRTWIAEWPVYRQLAGPDATGRGAAVKSKVTAANRPRVATADRVVKSICPYCAVGCGQNVYVSGGKVTQIEGIRTRRSAAAGCARRARPACS